MNDKVTIGQLAEDIARINGCSPQLAEAYLRAVADEVVSQLVAGNAAHLKQIGVFSPDDNAEGATFTLDTSLASMINEPFEVFEKVELHDSVTDSMLEEVDESVAHTPEMVTELSSVDESENNHPEEVVAAEPKAVAAEAPSEAIPEPEVESHEAPCPAVEPAVAAPIETMQPVEDEIAEAEPPAVEPTMEETPVVEESAADDDSHHVDESSAESTCSWIVSAIIGFLIGLIIGAFASYWYVSYEMDQARAPYEEMYDEPAAE